MPGHDGLRGDKLYCEFEGVQALGIRNRLTTAKLQRLVGQ